MYNVKTLYRLDFTDVGDAFVERFEVGSVCYHWS